MNRWAFITSIVLHVGIFILFTVPFFTSSPRKNMPTPLTVKVLPISKKTNLPEKQNKKTVKDQARKKDMKAQKKKQPKKVMPEVKKKAPQKKKDTQKKAVLPKKDDKRKHEEKAAVAKKPTIDDDFLAALKTVEDLPDKVVEDKKEKNTTPDTSRKIEDVLSMSELDVLRQQLRQCWSLPAGAKDAKFLSIDVEVQVNPEGVVQQTKIKNNILSGNPYDRVAMESAKRALYHPDCTPLKLPKSKFEQWSTFIVTFDPKEMFE